MGDPVKRAERIGKGQKESESGAYYGEYPQIRQIVADIREREEEHEKSKNSSPRPRAEDEVPCALDGVHASSRERLGTARHDADTAQQGMSDGSSARCEIFCKNDSMTSQFLFQRLFIRRVEPYPVPTSKLDRYSLSLSKKVVLQVSRRCFKVPLVILEEFFPRFDVSLQGIPCLVHVLIERNVIFCVVTPDVVSHIYEVFVGALVYHHTARSPGLLTKHYSEIIPHSPRSPFQFPHLLRAPGVFLTKGFSVKPAAANEHPGEFGFGVAVQYTFALVGSCKNKRILPKLALLNVAPEPVLYAFQSQIAYSAVLGSRRSAARTATVQPPHVAGKNAGSPTGTSKARPAAEFHRAWFDCVISDYFYSSFYVYLQH